MPTTIGMCPLAAFGKALPRRLSLTFIATPEKSSTCYDRILGSLPWLYYCIHTRRIDLSQYFLLGGASGEGGIGENRG
jgi:hypothetical protein